MIFNKLMFGVEHHLPLSADLAAVAARTKGFMPVDEGDALHDAGVVAAQERARPARRDRLVLRAVGDLSRRRGARRGTVLFSVDHHRGSEENQSGWDHHDTEVVDPATGRMDTLPFFRRTLVDAELEDAVVGVVG